MLVFFRLLAADAQLRFTFQEEKCNGLFSHFCLRNPSRQSKRTWFYVQFPVKHGRKQLCSLMRCFSQARAIQFPGRSNIKERDLFSSRLRLAFRLLCKRYKQPAKHCRWFISIDSECNSHTHDTHCLMASVRFTCKSAWLDRAPNVRQNKQSTKDGSPQTKDWRLKFQTSC